MRPHGSTEELERRRVQALKLLHAGQGPKAVAEALGVSRQAVHNWINAYQQAGPKGLAGKPSPGRAPKLSAPQRQQLAALLEAGAQQAGFESDLWTGPRVAELIRQRFGVQYHRCHITRLLRDLGFTPQKPMVKAREQDPQAAARWRKKDWPRIKKGRSRAS